MSVKTLGTAEALGRLQDPGDREMFAAVAQVMGGFPQGHSRLQIESFILNAIEYGTPYGRYQQACVELASRYWQLVDGHYELRKLEVQRRLLERQAAEQGDDLKRELLEIEAERLALRAEGRRQGLLTLAREARVFYEVYEAHPEFHELAEEERADLEAAQWAHKATQMPLVFEERYGPEFMRQALGDGLYEQFVAARRQAVGVLPRELFSGGGGVRQLGPGVNGR